MVTMVYVRRGKGMATLPPPPAPLSPHDGWITVTVTRSLQLRQCVVCSRRQSMCASVLSRMWRVGVVAWPRIGATSSESCERSGRKDTCDRGGFRETGFSWSKYSIATVLETLGER